MSDATRPVSALAPLMVYGAVGLPVEIVSFSVKWRRVAKRAQRVQAQIGTYQRKMADGRQPRGVEQARGTGSDSSGLGVWWGARAGGVVGAPRDSRVDDFAPRIVTPIAHSRPDVRLARVRASLGMAKVEPMARWWLGLAGMLIVVVVVAGGAAPWLIPQSRIDQTELVLGIAQASLLFASAGLGLLSGHWVARTSAGFACAALFVLAFAAVASATSVGQAGFAPVMNTGGAALAVVLLLAAAAAPEVDDSASFRRVLSREAGPVHLLALVALTPVVDAVLIAGMTMSLPGRIVLSALVAGGWLAAGAQVLRLGRPRLGWLPAVLLILAVAAVFRAFVGVGSPSFLAALGLEALAGSFALLGAVLGMRAALVGTAEGMTSVLQDLSAMRDEDSRRRADDSERLHEVRSVLAGLYAARATLRKYEDSLDPGDRLRLQDVVGEELRRLNQLIDPPAPEVTTELDLEAVVMSVVLAAREQGLVITTDLADVWVRGRAVEIATLVSDLLVNARVHAPGSAVRLSARAEGGVAALEIRDWGPGLSAIEDERVFDRAVRGTRPIAQGIPGSGLGLYTARKRARQMNGDLRIRHPAGGGCCLVVTLPPARRGDELAPWPQPVDPVLETVAYRPRQQAAAKAAHWSRKYADRPGGRRQFVASITRKGVNLPRRGSEREGSQPEPERIGDEPRNRQRKERLR